MIYSSQFVVFICCYIISLVACLILMVVGKNATLKTFKTALLIHLFFALVFLILLLFFCLFDSVSYTLSYGALAYLCSGVAISGMIFRSKMNRLIKIYFGIFTSSFLIFVTSPSTLFSIITKGSLTVENYDRFLIIDNYYLDKQSSFNSEKNTLVKYKIVQKLGYFNKTISRDLAFNQDLDSIKTLKFDIGNSTNLRGYFHHLNKTDSIDIAVDLKTISSKNKISSNPN